MEFRQIRLLEKLDVCILILVMYKSIAIRFLLSRRRNYSEMDQAKSWEFFEFFEKLPPMALRFLRPNAEFKDEVLKRHAHAIALDHAFE